MLLYGYSMSNLPSQQDDFYIRAFEELREIAANVSVYRARAKLSQAALAKKSGLSRSVISDIERAASAGPSFGTLLRLATGLGVTLSALFETTERGMPDDDELLRRVNAGDDECISSQALHTAIAERDKGRYSKAGRPRSTASNKNRAIESGLLPNVAPGSV